jgi:hypothetical protein
MENLRGEIRLLATFLFAFAAIKVVASSLAYTSAIVAAGGTDVDASRTLFWLPQVLFYTLFATAARRLRRFEPRARSIVLSLAALSIGATVLYTVLDFAVGPAHQRPAMAIAIKLRLLAGGDIWDIVFPALAIAWLRPPDARRLFEPQ